MKASAKLYLILVVPAFVMGTILTLVMYGPLASHASVLQNGSTFTVNSELDVVDAAVGDGLCETAEGACTLRAAIQEANVTDVADEIMLPAGTYTLSIVGTEEDEAAFGDLDITYPLAISGFSAEETIISGNHIDRVFHNLAETTMSDLTIRDGVQVDGIQGSAIHNGASLFLESVTITNNIQANINLDLHGSHSNAIYTTENLTIQNSLIAQNHTGLQLYGSPTIEIRATVFRDNDDGAIRGRGTDYGQTANVTIQNSQIISNTSVFENSGVSLYSASLNIDQSIIENNQNSIQGSTNSNGNSGGIYLNEGVLTLTRSSVSNNVVGIQNNSISGGGLAIYRGRALIKDSTIANNKSEDGSGGGILSFGGNIEIVDSSIINNQAGTGGGIHATGGGQINVQSSTISGNIADWFGGGIYNGATFNNEGQSIVLLANSTIANNSAEGEPELGENFADGKGGGLWNSEMVVFYHSVLANNSADQGADCYSEPVMISLGYNLIEDGSPCPMSGETGTNILATDPLLMDLGDNGGNTMTHLPQTGSPLIDAGNPAGCFDAELDVQGGLAEIADQIIPFDQRGFYRTVAGSGDAAARCDIGAVEALSEAPVLDQIIFLPIAMSDYR